MNPSDLLDPYKVRRAEEDARASYDRKFQRWLKHRRNENTQAAKNLLHEFDKLLPI